MRWIPPEVFTAGEPNPHPVGTAVRRRLRAKPRDPRPGRTWLLPSVNGVRAWRGVYDRHYRSVLGHAWIRRSALRWRRLAWTLWALALIATLLVDAVPHGGSLDSAPRLGVPLAVLALAALTLAAVRIRAVIDPDDGHVGIPD